MCSLRPFSVLVVLVLLVSLFSPVITGSGTGPARAGHIGAATVEGRVTDGTGGVLPGVPVVLVSATGTQVAKTVTDKLGTYRFTNVAPGRYEVRAELPGFTSAVVVVFLTEGRVVRQELVLHVAGVQETVQVTGAAPTVDMKSASMAAVAMRQPAPWGWAWIAPRTTSFDRIEENRFTRVVDNPLSTFSIDVDTASYAYLRRAITSGSLPSKDSVRVEEFLNYFRYDYPEPQGERPLSVTTEVARCPWEPRHALLHIGVQAARGTGAAPVRRNLVFLLDVSGSMDAPDKLPLVKSAMSLLANRLTERDTVAIVVYAGSSGVALPPTRGDRHDLIQQAIGRLQAGGSTNGAEGIEQAYQLASQGYVDGGVNRVILATDGDFNVGVTSRADLLSLIEARRKSGIYLSVLGVGDDNLQDGMMEQLADRGNGNYAYLDTLDEAQKVLVREAEATLIPVADDVKLQVEFNPRHVVAYRLIGYENRALRPEDFKDDKKDAGEIGAGQSVTALYELVPAREKLDAPQVDALRYQEPRKPSASAASAEIAHVKLRYKQPGTARSVPMDVVVESPRDMNGAMSGNLGFSSAIAVFAMMLRDSPDKGTATWRLAADLGRTHRGADPDGYRAQFVRLVEMAEGLVAANVASQR